MQVADNAVDLAAARGVLQRAALLIDEHHAANPASDGTAAELEALFAEAQAAKAFVNEAAARIVDRALALSGGAGYLNGARWRAPTATSGRGRSCTRWAPTAVRLPRASGPGGAGPSSLSRSLAASSYQRSIWKRARTGPDSLLVWVRALATSR